MRTARALTVSPSMFCAGGGGGGVPAPWGGEPGPGGCTWSGGTWSWGGVPGPGG